MTAKNSVILPVMMTCLGYFLYNLSDAGTKMLALRFHWTQVVFMAAAAVFLFMTGYGWFRDGKKAFRTRKPRLVLLHAAMVQVSAFANILAFSHMPLTTFYTLAFTAPFWIALLAALFMKDKLDAHRLGAIVFGFIVVLAIFRPGAESFNAWSLMMLVSAFVYAGRMLVLRLIGSEESRTFMFVVSSFTTMVVVTPFMLPHALPLAVGDFAILAGVMLVNGVGLLCVSWAFQAAGSPSTVAPYHYTQIVWGALLGYVLFGELPSRDIVAGAALLITAGVYLITQETRRINKNNIAV